MGFQSMSSSRLHCCIVLFILIIVVFLTATLLVNFLANDDLEATWEKNQYQSVQNFTCSTPAKPNDGQPVQCPDGSFPCTSCPHECVKQSKICDNNNDCPDRSDESGCHDSNGAVGAMFKLIYDARSRLSSNMSALAKPDSCELTRFFNEECACNMSEPRVIICDGFGLRSIPDDLSASVFKIRMSDNQIESLDHVRWPPALTSLALINNRIRNLSKVTFRGSTPNLIKLYLNQNDIAEIDVTALAGLENLSWLELESNRLRSFNTELLKHTPAITRIHLSENEIELPLETRFSVAPNLRDLLLDHNKITNIKRHWFSNMPQLFWLSLDHNRIESIEPNSFDGDYELTELNLSFNRIKVIDQRVFAHRLNIQRLYLSGNPIETLSASAFRELMELKSLNLTQIVFKSLDRDTFAHLRHLEFIYFEEFRFCHYATRVRVCKPITDGLSSKEQLLAFPILKYAVWIVALVCSVGNVFVFVWRSLSPHEDQTLSLFVRNLSIADLMMGVYLCTIGWQDWKFKRNFHKNAIEWMASCQCTAIGSLAILSSELSVFILTVITVERYRAIVSISHIEERAQRHRARLFMILAWIFSFLIAFYPLFEWWRRDTQSYATNGLCLPLHIDQPLLRAWEVTYLAINFVAVLLIICLYARMYILIMDNHQTSRPVSLFKIQKREDAILAIRFFFIVLTDCLSWIPIVVIKLMALAEMRISPSIYGWLVVFVIPINSALNPIVYTLAAPTTLRTAICRAFGRMCLGLDHLARPRRARHFGSNSTTTCDTYDTSVASRSENPKPLAPLSKESSFSNSSSTNSSPSVRSHPGAALADDSAPGSQRNTGSKNNQPLVSFLRPLNHVTSLETNSSIKHSVLQPGEQVAADGTGEQDCEGAVSLIDRGDKKPASALAITTRRETSRSDTQEQRPGRTTESHSAPEAAKRASSTRISLEGILLSQHYKT